MPVAAKKAIAAKTAKTAKAVTSATKPAPVAKPPSAVGAKPKLPEAVKAVKPVKEKKPKLVRDSFTMPKLEYALFDELKSRANQLASPAKKSELLRAGIKALAAMSDAAFLAALKAVPAIKTGRPGKS